MDPNSTQGPIGTPASEHPISVELVTQLLTEQHPDLVHMPIHLVDSGWDNSMFRLGESYAIRLPRRQLAASLIEHEQTWLPYLSDRLPIPIPVPLRVGLPTAEYPWRWSIVPWLPGTTADQQVLRPDQSDRFATFLSTLHQPAPPNAPSNPYRGVPLQQRATAVEERMQRLENTTELITPEIKKIWQQALNSPIDIAPTWLHGDLHPRNILVENSEITGVIDWGDLTCGDRATDLATFWMLFHDPIMRHRAIATYGPLSEATLNRAKGWAILFGVILLDSGLVDNPQHAAIGSRILHTLEEDG